MNLLLGHLVGDYLLQNKWMAMNKNGNSFKCMIHCLIYTLSVCCFTECYKPLWICIVFASHFIIDRFSLADSWLDWIDGRSLSDFMKNGQNNIPEEYIDEAKQDPTAVNYYMLRGGFTALVYTAVDNTMHLVIMYLAYINIVSN